MSHVTVGGHERGSWDLKAAVLVYGSEHNSRDESVYATVHGIEKRGQKYSLAAGMPATKEACSQLARALGAASTITGFMPENLLYLGGRSIIWWRPPAPATVYFDTTRTVAGDQTDDKTAAALIGKKTGRTPQPGLVFAITTSSWYVFAVAGAARPTLESKLLRAPYFNVWTSGQICTGNVRLPESLSPAALQRFERAFFDSEFTHPNVRGKERLVNHPKGAYALWASLFQLPAGQPFPEAHLIPLKSNLQRLAKQLESGNRVDDE